MYGLPEESVERRFVDASSSATAEPTVATGRNGSRPVSGPRSCPHRAAGGQFRPFKPSRRAPARYHSAALSPPKRLRFGNGARFEGIRNQRAGHPINSEQRRRAHDGKQDKSNSCRYGGRWFLQSQLGHAGSRDRARAAGLGENRNIPSRWVKRPW
jgi:hypothetical protein